MRRKKAFTLAALLVCAVLLVWQARESSAVAPGGAHGVQQSAGPAAAAVAPAPTDCGPGERTFIRYEVKSGVDEVYIRHNPQGFTLGTLFRRQQAGPHLIRSDRFDVQKTDKGYGYGCTPEGPNGHRRCGWALLSKLRPTGFTGRATGPCSQRIQPEAFCILKNSVTKRNCRESKGSGSGAFIRGTPPRYGNYAPGPDGGPSDSRSDIRLTDGQKVLWRYITPGGGFVLLKKLTQEDSWVFVPRANVRLNSETHACGRCP
jgi:hypothetical protein